MSSSQDGTNDQRTASSYGGIESVGDRSLWLEGRQIDSDARLMEASHRLRYQVYCVERGFLDSRNYPDGCERDEFDRYALHLGVIDSAGGLLATARMVRVGFAGLPLFRHCEIFPNETELYRDTNNVIEVSRLCVSRQLRQLGFDRNRVVTSLYRALYQASKRQGFTHWLAATEHSLQRLVSNFGFPFRAIGPCTDYFGCVSPYLMSLRDFDEVIRSRRYPALDSFMDGLEPAANPGSCVQAI